MSKRRQKVEVIFGRFLKILQRVYDGWWLVVRRHTSSSSSTLLTQSS